MEADCRQREPRAGENPKQTTRTGRRGRPALAGYPARPLGAAMRVPRVDAHCHSQGPAPMDLHRFPQQSGPYALDMTPARDVEGVPVVSGIAHWSQGSRSPAAGMSCSPSVRRRRTAPWPLKTRTSTSCWSSLSPRRPRPRRRWPTRARNERGCTRRWRKSWMFLVRLAGIEPATPAFGGQYSIH